MAETQPTEIQMQALRGFAARHGRTWKSKLLDHWMSGAEHREPDHGPLREVRNMFGPSWLARFKLPSWTTRGENGEANARLIAAAPDLIEALQAILSEVDARFLDRQDPLLVQAENARAAIAKAEGRS